MNRQTKAALLAISIVIPISLYAVWSTDKIKEETTQTTETKIQVIASFFPLYDFAREVGKDRADVSMLVPPGVEPHDWEPSIKEVQRLQSADLVLINGLGFEAWIDDVDSIDSQIMVVDTSQNVEGLKVTELHDHEENYDPHVWLNPPMAKSQVKSIVNAFSVADPDNKKFYEKNGNLYLQKLDKLDEKIHTELQSCRKDFISFHSAFSYFANEYGLNQHTILESTDSHVEPTSKKIQRIIQLAQDLNIDVIFSEEEVDKRTSLVIADEIGGTVKTLSTLELTSLDSSYIEKMENNLSNLKEALC